MITQLHAAINLPSILLLPPLALVADGQVRQNMLQYTLNILLNDLTPRSRVLPAKPSGSQLVKKFPAFMEPEGSLPHSQANATCPYPESHKSRLSLPITFLEDPF